MLSRISVMAAIFSLAGAASAAEYCLCDGLLIDYTDGAKGFELVMLQSPVTASPQTCGLACDAETGFDCNTAIFIPGSDACSLYNLDHKRDGSTIPANTEQTLASGTCASYGIDTAVTTACQDYEAIAPVLPTQVTRRRQLNNERKKRNAAAAGIY